MINLNSNIEEDQELNFASNRAFLYADALFDTLIFKNNKIVFAEEHYFRLLASMRQLRMEIPHYFTQEFWEKEIFKTIQSNKLSDARVRTSIFRESGGLYTPNRNSIQFVIQTSLIDYQTKPKYRLGIYKDNYINTSSLNTIKTTNRLQNVLAAIYAKENEFDTCILLNHKKQIAEVIHANIFVVFGTQIKTPALTEGCVNGIIRNKVIDLITKIPDLNVVKGEISPYELQQATEVFITNSVIGIQPVTHYKKKEYDKKVAQLLQEKLQSLI